MGIYPGRNQIRGRTSLLHSFRSITSGTSTCHDGILDVHTFAIPNYLDTGASKQGLECA